jgi:hypothetical protein
MSDTWLDYLNITQHPFLDRFHVPGAIEVMYADAVRGLPTILLNRPEHWYQRTHNVLAAIDRIGEMAADRLTPWLKDEKSGLYDDLLLILEDCESTESRDLIQKIQDYYPERPAMITYSDGPPATEKQRGFLRKLGVKNFNGTMAQASAKIDELLPAKN